MKKEIALPTTRKPFFISASSFVVFVSTVFVVLFGSTGIDKLRTIEKFAATMKGVKIVRPYADFLSYFVPLFELFIALLIAFSFVVIKKTVIPLRIGLYLSALLMFEFCIYVGAMLVMYNAQQLPCRCGGVVEWLTWRQHLYFNIGLFLLSISAIVVMKKNKI